MRLDTLRVSDLCHYVNNLQLALKQGAQSDAHKMAYELYVDTGECQMARSKGLE